MALLALIFTLPLIPAAIVFVLVKRSPPGVAITPLMSAVIAEMQAIPKPEADAPAITFASRFQPGQIYEIEVGRTVESGDAPPRREERRFRLEVLTADPTTARLELSRHDRGDATVLGRAKLVFRWDADGFLEAETDAGPLVRDLRDSLFKREGLLLPGPFPQAVAVNDWLAPPGREPSAEARAVLDAAGLELGREEMPHRGGLMPRQKIGGKRAFRLLGYRRFAVETPDKRSGEEKVGVYEFRISGRLDCPDGEIAPSECELKTVERIGFEHRGTAFEGEVLGGLVQRIRRIEGGTR